MAHFVAILEDNPERLDQMRRTLAELLPQFEHVYLDDAPAMIAWLENHLSEVVLISLDNDLPLDSDHGTGRDVADWLSTQIPICPVIVHTSNEFFAPGMMGVLKESQWLCERVYPHSDHDWICARVGRTDSTIQTSRLDFLVGLRRRQFGIAS